MSVVGTGSIDLAALPQPGDHVVYRIYAHADELIYVGVTNHLLRRLSHHMSRDDMRFQIVRVEWTEFETRYEAETTEAIDINRMAPLLNIVGGSR